MDEIAKRGVATERRVPRYDGILPPEPCAAPMPKVQPTMGARPEDDYEYKLVPWLATRAFFIRREVPEELVAKFWSRRTPGLYVLEPHVVSENLPRSLQGFYNMRGETWTLQINRVPADARDFFPNLEREKNMKEWEELPAWQRVLYTWNDGATKYELSDMSRAWHVEAE